MVRTALLAAAATLAATAACGSGRTPDRDLGDLVVAPDEKVAPIDVPRAAREPSELGRAIALPYHEVVTRLGVHTLVLHDAVVVHEGANQVDALTTDTTVELGADGAWHALSNNSADYGREAIWSGGALYLRPRYARWHKRAPNDEAEPDALRDEYAGELAAVWDLLAPGVELSDRGARTVAGRGGKVIEVKLSPSPKKPQAEPLAQRKWRESRVVEAAAGEVVLDDATGVPLAAKLAGKVAFMRDGRRFTLTVDLTAEVKDVGTAAAITLPAPEETVATPERLKEVDDRDAILKGIAPPIRAEGDEPAPAAATPPAAPAPAPATATPAGKDESP
jgi:hypothetical protein